MQHALQRVLKKANEQTEEADTLGRRAAGQGQRRAEVDEAILRLICNFMPLCVSCLKCLINVEAH